MSTLIRKKKGNLVLAIFMLILALFVFIYGLFSGLGKDLSIAEVALGSKFDVKNIGAFFKSLRFQHINWCYAVMWAGPLITSILALIFRRYRFINLLNLVLFGYALAVVFIPLFLAADINTIIKSLFSKGSIYYLPVFGAHFVGLVFALVNTELCR